MDKRLTLTIFIVILALAACQKTTPTTVPVEVVPTLPTPAGALISEVMAGVSGNNNHEFIELYNPGQSVFRLQGFTLWYRLPSGEEEFLVYTWNNEALIPAQGHYLLVRQGEELGIKANATFTQALNTSGGGLALRDPQGETIDSLGWGNAPAAFTEGAPAPALENGTSLERKPGGENGNGLDTDDNEADFILSQSPQSQNSGSDPTPYIEQPLQLRLEAPESVQPGSDFEYSMTVTNMSDQVLEEVAAQFTLPAGLTLQSSPPSITVQDQTLTWNVGRLAPNDALTETLSMSAPWDYLDFSVEDFFARIGEATQTYFAVPVHTHSEGGTIPIGTARGLIDAELSVEGVATMYTGGYYAGSGDVKFYLEDASGGLQVQVFDGEGEVSVPIGALVRVQGIMGIYRDAIQIVPNVPGDVEILAATADAPIPLTQASILQAVYDRETLPGKLIQVQGTVTRVEEFSYSYEIDLTDETGNLLTLYVDKLTEMSVEEIELGHDYQATGILDLRDGNALLYPRLQTDLQELFQPVLMLETEAPNTILPGEVFTVTLTAANHSQTTLEDVLVTTTLPATGARLEAIQDGGTRSGDEITWLIPRLEGDGGKSSVSFELTATGASDQILIKTLVASNNDEVEIVQPQPWRIFIGTDLPIWAIQGTSDRSPYVLDEATTVGVVTGVFPDLEGFWIQSAESDEDPLTSEGIFVFVAAGQLSVSQGDLVEVHGHIRETGQQTQIEVASPEDIQVLQEDATLPLPVELDPPLDDQESQQYYEALEGMLVQVSEEAVATSPTSRYGEYTLVLSKHGVDRVWQGEQAGFLITVDDGSSEVHYDRSTLEYAIHTGDSVTGLQGPLAYTYGVFKIEPLTLPEIIPGGEIPQDLAPVNEDEFSLMTWNVENLFDILVPHPSDPPLPRKADYDLDLTKIANTILAAGAPMVIGLQEVENLGILEDLAGHELLEGYGYIPILLEGSDSRGIDVGYLVRGDRARVIDVQQFPAPEGLTSRHPLLIQVEVESSAGSITLYVINNHFLSMSGGELATEPRRSAQAAWNVSIVESILTEDPGAYVAVLGDLNSYFDSKPIDILREAGLRHVFEILPEEERYTYIYQGASQTLDHILVSGGLMERLKRVEVLHADADFPPADPNDSSPLHQSDHDPLVATFGIRP